MIIFAKFETNSEDAHRTCKIFLANTYLVKN